MGFENLQRLPSAQLDIPKYQPYIQPPPPVYDTSATIHSLQALAEYMSPNARALRQAAVAKANYEYRMYRPGGLAEKNAMWMSQLRQSQMQRNMALAAKYNALSHPQQDPNI